MSIEKENKHNWLNIANTVTGILWGLAGILCILPAVTVPLFFDSPSPSANANDLFIFSVLCFPPVCIAASLAILFLKKRFGILAICFSALPVLPLILVFVGSTWMSLASCGKFDCSTPTLQEQGNAIQVGKCALPVPDGGDGLKTTGCGVLKAGVIATGMINSPSEAHNWQFSAQNGARVTITVEHHDNSCSQIKVLDANGSVIESFKTENQANVCSNAMPSSMITTTFYYFNPPGQGTYILRITAPQAPSSYWFKID